MVAKGTRKLWALDNLDALARLEDGSVQLAYLDPPFNSNRTYDSILASSRSAGDHRHESFVDEWDWTEDSHRLALRLSEWLAESTVEAIQALLHNLSNRGVKPYLTMMLPRLAEVHRVLASDGALYVHCDASASHYLKVVLDQIFGAENFRNEVVWKRTHAHSGSRRFGPVHDIILFYTKGSRYTWNKLYSDYSAAYLDKHFRNEDDHGRYQLITCTAPGDRTGTRAHYSWKGQLPPPGRHWAWRRERMEEFEREGRLVYSSNGVPRLKRYTDDGPGVPLQDVWTDINRLDANSGERVGFETQKPLGVVERAIAASSNAGDLVLDPFGGSGTTAVAAERLGRQWVCIDRSLTACSTALSRVRQEVNLASVELDGFPSDVRAATRLKREEPLAFALWGTGMLATVLDRGQFQDSVATGRGKLKGQRRSIDVISYVPLQDTSEVVVPRTKGGRLSKQGFVLETGPDDARARELVQERVNYPVHDVPVESLVAAQARRTGLAEAVTNAASPA